MTHEDIWTAIERFAKAHQMSCSGLAKCSGLDATTFNRSKRFSKEGKPRWPSMHSLSKILSATGANISEFARLIPEHEGEES